MPGATTHHPPTTPQLLTMKADSDNKVSLVKMSQDDPLNPSSKKNYQVDSDNNNLGGGGGGWWPQGLYCHLPFPIPNPISIPNPSRLTISFLKG